MNNRIYSLQYIRQKPCVSAAWDVSSSESFIITGLLSRYVPGGSSNTGSDAINNVKEASQLTHQGNTMKSALWKVIMEIFMEDYGRLFFHTHTY